MGDQAGGFYVAGDHALVTGVTRDFELSLRTWAARTDGHAGLERTRNLRTGATCSSEHLREGRNVPHGFQE